MKSWKPFIAGAAALLVVAGGAYWRVGRVRRRQRADLLAQADKLRRDGRLGEALALIEDGLKSRPGEPDYLALRASLLLQDGRFEAAADDAAQAVHLRPDAEAFITKGRALAHIARLEEALQAYDEAFKVSKSPDPGMLLERGELKLRLARFQPAIDDLGSALDQGLAGADRRRALDLRARARSAMGDLAGGLKDLDLAAAVGEPDSMTLLLRAQARERLGDPAGAAEDAGRILKSEPSNLQACLIRAEARLAQGDRRGALKDLKKAEKLAPGDPQLEALKARAKGKRR